MRRLPLVIAATITLGVVVLFSSILQVTVVQGESMMPTLRHGQVVLALRRFRALKRGDMVLIRRGTDILIKRVVYLPGDRITRLDRALFRRVTDFFDKGDDNGSLIVPAGRVVVLGDNRLHSDDSRQFGPVPLKDVIGRIIAVSRIP